MVYSKVIASQHFGDADTCLDRKSGCVHWVNVRAGIAKTSFTLYDGTDSAGDKMFTAEVAASPSSMYRFMPPLSYDKGLFVDVDASIGDFTICYEPTE